MMWRSYIWDRPQMGQRIVLASEPDFITHYEPRPLSGPLLAVPLPPWKLVAGLLWRPWGSGA